MIMRYEQPEENDPNTPEESSTLEGNEKPRITDEQVAALLKENGPDSEFQAYIWEWIQQCEREMIARKKQAPEALWAEIDQVESMRALMRRAEIYLSAGYAIEAYDLLFEEGFDKSGPQEERDHGIERIASESGIESLMAEIMDLRMRIENALDADGAQG